MRVENVGNVKYRKQVFSNSEITESILFKCIEKEGAVLKLSRRVYLLFLVLRLIQITQPATVWNLFRRFKPAIQ
jgi:hypothetical protein